MGKVDVLILKNGICGGEENLIQLIQLEKPHIFLNIFEIHIIEPVFGHSVKWRHCICITVSIWTQALQVLE
jgi:hypothetical protein